VPAMRPSNSRRCPYLQRQAMRLERTQRILQDITPWIRGHGVDIPHHGSVKGHDDSVHTSDALAMRLKGLHHILRDTTPRSSGHEVNPCTPCSHILAVTGGDKASRLSMCIGWLISCRSIRRYACSGACANLCAMHRVTQQADRLQCYAHHLFKGWKQKTVPPTHWQLV
jgi:hypothetical protein